MPDIHFIRDDSAKERAQLFREVQDLVKADSKKSKRALFGTRFIYSMIASVKVKPPEILLPPPPIIMSKPKPEPKVKAFVPKLGKIVHSNYPVHYTILLQDSKPLVTASIDRDSYGKLTYKLIEPQIDKRLVNLVKKKVAFRYRINKKILDDREYIQKKIKRALKKLKIQHQEGMYDKVRYYLERDFVNLGKIDALLHDSSVRKIICDGNNKPLEILHKKSGVLNSNIALTKNEINYIIQKIAEKKHEKISKKTLSLNILIEGFRMKATIGTVLFSSKFILTRELP